MNNGQLLKQMGDKIRAERMARGWTYPVMAERSGLNMSNFWFIEQGTVNLHLLTLKAIADAFKMEVKDFL